MGGPGSGPRPDPWRRRRVAELRARGLTLPEIGRPARRVSASMTPSNKDPRPDSSSSAEPLDVLGGLLSETDSRRRQEAEANRIDVERNRQLSEHQTQRQRLADAFDLACSFPAEENMQGRKPCPDGFRRWAERFLAVGAVLRDCDAAIGGMRLAERLREAAASDAPAPMKFACALLLLAFEGHADPVASSLASANGDAELRQFVLWLPFVLDNLWNPSPGEDGLIRVALSPDGTSRAENQKAERGFGWRPCGLPTDPPDPPLLDTPEKILSRCEAIQRQQAEFARKAARGVRTDASGAFVAYLRGELGDAYPLPTLEPLWNAAQALNLGNVPPWRGEPQTGPEAFEALTALADWCRRQIVGPTGDPATVWYHGGRSYSADRKTPRLVPAEQHNALSAFLDRDEALDTKALANAGVSNVSAVMGKLASQFGNSVRLPENKGDGYFIRVRTAGQGTPTD
jgi:hypothetical protein